MSRDANGRARDPPNNSQHSRSNHHYKEPHKLFQRLKGPTDGPFGLYVWCPSKSQGRKIPKRPPEKAPTMPPNSARLVGVLLLGRIELPASDWDEGRCENRWECPLSQRLKTVMDYPVSIVRRPSPRVIIRMNKRVHRHSALHIDDRSPPRGPNNGDHFKKYLRERMLHKTRVIPQDTGVFH